MKYRFAAQFTPTDPIHSRIWMLFEIILNNVKFHLCRSLLAQSRSWKLSYDFVPTDRLNILVFGESKLL